MPNNLGISDEEFERRFDDEIDLDAIELQEMELRKYFVGPLHPPCDHKWKLITTWEMCGLDGDDVEVYECKKCKEQVMSDTPWWENSNG